MHSKKRSLNWEYVYCLTLVYNKKSGLRLENRAILHFNNIIRYAGKNEILNGKHTPVPKDTFSPHELVFANKTFECARMTRWTQQLIWTAFQATTNGGTCAKWKASGIWYSEILIAMHTGWNNLICDITKPCTKSNCTLIMWYQVPLRDWLTISKTDST